MANNNHSWYYSGQGLVELSDPDAQFISKDKNGKFYFWDEIQVDCYGPFDSHEEAVTGSAAYMKSIG